MMPGDPLRFILGEEVVLMTYDQIEEARIRHGLDRPLIQQYWDYISNLLSGDFGFSPARGGRPVAELIGDRLPWTLLLQSLNIIISTLIGVFFGTIAAWSRGKKIDIILNNVFIFFRSMPSFWIGMILIAVFSAGFGWLPIFGAQTNFPPLTGMDRVIDIARHAVLPLTTLVLLSVSSTYLIMRYSMIDVLGEDFILMLKMKGLPDKKVRITHGMRNALIPVATVVMLNVGFMVGGSVIVETVFTYPGMGRLMFEAVINRDFPTLQACLLIMTLCVIAANIIADILYPLIDPRVV